MIGWVVLGALLGLVTLQRLQDGVFAFIVALEMFQLFVDQLKGKQWEQLGRGVVSLSAFAAGLLVMLLPQVVTWLVLYGRVYANVYQESVGLGFDWLHPRIAAVLFSSRHGLLSWTPLIAFGLIGLVLFHRRDGVLTLELTVVFGLELYLVSSWPYWYQGASFGGRMFVSCSVLFALGLAALIEWLGHRFPLRWIASMGSLFVVWNYVLLYQYGTGMISRERGISWLQVLQNAAEVPLLVIQMVLQK